MNIPKLRFKDNNGNNYPQWEKKKLGDISDIRDGTHDSPKYINNGYPLITSKNIQNGKISFDNINYISKEDYDNINKRSNVSVGDIIMGMIGTIGNVALLSEENFAIKNVALFKEKTLLKNIFLIQYLQSDIFYKSISNLNEGGTQKFISLKNIRNLYINIPFIEEQEKIANFLIIVDKKIENLENTITSLENQKKGLLQQIFSQKLRFKDENGNNYPNWEKKKLGDIFTIKAGGDICKENFSKQYSSEFKYPIYANALTNKGLYGYSNIYKIDKPSITVTGRGDVGFALSRKPFYYPIVRLLVLIPNININFTFFTESINFIHIFNESTGVPQLTAPQLSKVNVYVPNIEEQNKIGNLFDKLNEKIDNKKAQLEHWQQIKKGLLQQMFV